MSLASLFRGGRIQIQIQFLGQALEGTLPLNLLRHRMISIFSFSVHPLVSVQLICWRLGYNPPTRDDRANQLLTGRNRPVNKHNCVVSYKSKIHAKFNLFPCYKDV